MEQKSHILVVSQYFYPENFRINDICKEWVKRGHKVTVITGIPNYPEGKFYSGYGYFKRRTEKWEGMTIIRIPLIPRGKSAAGMVANYLSFVISAFFWTKFTKIKADYVFTFEVSPMTQALLGVWYKKRFKIPNYLYVQDLWPENVETVTGIHSPLVLKPIRKMVNYIYKNCDQIFATSPSFVKEIQKWVDEKEKVHYWPQYAEDFYKPVKQRERKEGGKFRIAFTGNIGYAQGLEILPKTAELLKQDNVNVEFAIVGDGRYRAEFEKEIKECQVDDMFVMMGRKPAEEIPEILATCDTAFLSFKDDPLFYMTIPAKLQSYMACGMPVIASVSGESERIIRESGGGICSKIGDVDDLYNKLRILFELSEDDLRNMSQNSIEYCFRHFEKKFLMDEIEKWFELKYRRRVNVC